mmetsp:Transcript_48480/g.87105  ORF Transcript_48480/g.87105 Transcript_48480/m.87105 type:complete len:230 (-) Transcript_48480:11-700(-)
MSPRRLRRGWRSCRGSWLGRRRLNYWAGLSLSGAGRRLSSLWLSCGWFCCDWRRRLLLPTAKRRKLMVQRCLCGVLLEPLDEGVKDAAYVEEDRKEVDEKPSGPDLKKNHDKCNLDSSCQTSPVPLEVLRLLPDSSICSRVGGRGSRSPCVRHRRRCARGLRRRSSEGLSARAAKHVVSRLGSTYVCIHVATKYRDLKLHLLQLHHGGGHHPLSIDQVCWVLHYQRDHL